MGKFFFGVLLLAQIQIKKSPSREGLLCYFGGIDRQTFETAEPMLRSFSADQAFAYFLHDSGRQSTGLKPVGGRDVC